MYAKSRNRAVILIVAVVALTLFSTHLKASSTGTCGGQTTTIPFDDVLPANVFFCSIAEAFFSGLSNGTDATHYSPSANVSREQMAAFVTRTLDQSLKRGSRRATAGQYWTPQGVDNLGMIGVGSRPYLVKSDGVDLWVANGDSGTVSRVRASDGKLLETWTGAPNAYGVLCALGKVFVTGPECFNPGCHGKLYQIDPTQTAGTVTTLASGLGADSSDSPGEISYDGEKIWTENVFTISIIILNPPTVTNISAGFNAPGGITFDGTNIWVTDNLSLHVGKLHKLNSSGAIILTADVGGGPKHPTFDGTNIWVPNFNDHTVSVVRAIGSLAGTVLATLPSNGQSPLAAAFDGERILVTNANGNNISLWRATDFTPILTVNTGSFSVPWGACSDGLNFWITLSNRSMLARL